MFDEVGFPRSTFQSILLADHSVRWVFQVLKNSALVQAKHPFYKKGAMQAHSVASPFQRSCQVLVSIQRTFECTERCVGVRLTTVQLHLALAPSERIRLPDSSHNLTLLLFRRFDSRWVAIVLRKAHLYRLDLPLQLLLPSSENNTALQSTC